MTATPFEKLKDTFNRHDLSHDISFEAFKSVAQAIVMRAPEKLNASQIAGMHRIADKMPDIKKDLGITA